MSPEALADLHAACFVTPRPWRAEEFAGLLGQPAVFLLCEPGGFALGQAVMAEAELLTLAVAPDARRQGIGRRLLARFEAEALARGARGALLEVAADNVAACALYRSAGYGERGQRKGYYRTPEGTRVDALVMGRALA